MTVNCEELMTTILALAAFFLQSATFALVIIAVRRQDIAAVVNSIVVFALALLPAAAEIVLPVVTTRGIQFDPVLPAWLAAAGFLHSLGMLGLYESTWWWDHLTHTVSAGLVTALIYAGVIVTLPEMAGRAVSPMAVVAATVVFTFALGVFWELLELVTRNVGDRFDIEPLLIHYGWRDTVADLGFNVVGIFLIIGTDLRIFVPLMDQFPDATTAVLIVGGWILVGSSVIMALAIALTSLRKS